jgi:hypothetical protein
LHVYWVIELRSGVLGFYPGFVKTDEPVKKLKWKGHTEMQRLLASILYPFLRNKVDSTRNPSVSCLLL